jgi:hypothetical protein
MGCVKGADRSCPSRLRPKEQPLQLILYPNRVGPCPFACFVDDCDPQPRGACHTCQGQAFMCHAFSMQGCG